MPNHCTNKLTVSGDVKQLKKFIKTVDKSKECHLDFNAVVPMPKELKDTEAPCDKNPKLEKKFGASNWYDWSIKNWGTKWNAYDALEWDAIYSDDVALIEFLTAWSPPTEFFINASKKFPKLTFENHYIDECFMFMGHYKIQNGEKIEEKHFQKDMFSKEGVKFRDDEIGYGFDDCSEFEIKERLLYIKEHPEDADKGEVAKLKKMLKNLD